MKAVHGSFFDPFPAFFELVFSIVWARFLQLLYAFLSLSDLDTIFPIWARFWTRLLGFGIVFGSFLHFVAHNGSVLSHG
jgi:hypothetical protein